MPLHHYLDLCRAAANDQAFWHALCRAARGIGYPWVALVLSGAGPSSTQPALTTYPAAWRDHYRARHYRRVDPVLEAARQVTAPFGWRDLPGLMALDPVQRRILGEAGEAGLADGVSVPLHGAAGQVACLTFARARGRVPEVHRQTLARLAHLFAADQLGSGVPAVRLPHLTGRERQCLTWACRGKSSWDIGRILGMSSQTVDFHLRNVRNKFGTGSRVAAGIAAMRLGLIDPDALEDEF